MVAVTPGVAGAVAATRRPVRWWRGAVLGAAGAYFLVPLYAAVHYSLTGDRGQFSLHAVASIPGQPGFGSAVWLSLRLLVVATGLSLGLMVPTAVYVHLRRPGLRRVLDVVTLLPLVVPPVVLAVGVLGSAPAPLKASPYLLALEYVVLAMPFVYRSLAAGLSAIDLRTLVEAGRSLGAGWWTTLRRVVVPNLRSSLLSATVLTVALVLGEFVLASLDQYQTFPVWIVAFDQDNSHVSTAVSFLALLLTWGLLLGIARLDRRRAVRHGSPGPEIPWGGA